MGQKTSGDPWSVRDSYPTRTSLRETISELVTPHSCTASLLALPSRNNIHPNLESYKNALPCGWESYRTPSQPIETWKDSLRGPPPSPVGVIYDSQPTNRNLGGLPARTLTLSGVLLLVAWKSYMTPSWLDYTKMSP
jgi:hypothetical protein